VAAATTAGGVVAVSRRQGWNVYARLRHRAARAGGRQGTGDETWTCSCGTLFRVTGAGRHRVLWPADAPQDEPVLDDHCPSCGSALPGGADGAGPAGLRA
jgi:hypothetical protein